MKLYKKDKLFWILNISGWSVYAIIDNFIKYRSTIIEIKYILGISVSILTGVFVCFVLRQIYRQLNYDRTHLAKLNFQVFFLSVVAALTWSLLDHVLSMPIWGSGWLDRRFGSLTIPQYFSIFLYLLFPFFVWSGLYWGIKFMMEWNSQKEKTKEAIFDAESAKQAMLRYQINPHFLFNAMTSARALVREDKNKAEDMISKISDFTRQILVSDSKKEIPLIEEINVLKKYVEIEKVRYGSKLEVFYNFDTNAEDFPVPGTILHPLVENAIKCGIRTSELPLEINISATIQNQKLKIEIENSGHWVESEYNKSGTGTGLKNVQNRLESYYPNSHLFSIEKSDNFVKVVLEIENNKYHPRFCKP